MVFLSDSSAQEIDRFNEEVYHALNFLNFNVKKPKKLCKEKKNNSYASVMGLVIVFMSLFPVTVFSV